MREPATRNRKRHGTHNRLATPEPVVERVRKPCANRRRSEVWRSIHDTDNPLVAGAIDRVILRDVELLREGQIGAIGASLIPTLRSSTDRALLETVRKT